MQMPSSVPRRHLAAPPGLLRAQMASSPPGARVTLRWLVSMPELNGKTATVLGRDHSAAAAAGYDNDRVPVMLESGVAILLKPQSLEGWLPPCPRTKDLVPCWAALPDVIVELLVSSLAPVCVLPALALLERRCHVYSVNRLAILHQLCLPPISIAAVAVVGTGPFTVDLSMRHLGNAGMETLAHSLERGALEHCTKVELSLNEIGDDGLNALARAITPLSKGGSSALEQCTQISLNGNDIGDTGMMNFCEALRDGAMAQCTKLVLGGNRISDDGMESLSCALAGGALKKCTSLLFNGNQIGDAGLAALARAITPASQGGSGALTQCTLLDLVFNRISYGGVKQLSSALAGGGMPALKELYMGNNVSALQEYQEACEARGIKYESEYG